MCGICGLVESESRERFTDTVDRMCQAMVHRGPDDQGVVVGNGFALGMRRLSIIDIAGGGQPIHNEDQSAWLVFNGEIYNYRELRDQLRLGGHRFHTDSDSEVIVHAYDQWGERCVERLNGMFAFALWDDRSRSLLLARDRMGIKPLYYLMDHGVLLFASESRALLASGRIPLEPDLISLDAFLAFEYVPTPRSIIRGVRKLPPGHTLSWDARLRTASIRQYWDVSLAEESTRSSTKRLKEQAYSLREMLKEAVQRELMSDVPLGVFLSGGLDSSAVAAMMTQLVPGRVNSFSIGFADPSFDESGYARQVAGRLGTNHRELVLESSMLSELLPAVMDRIDEPLADASLLPTFLLSRFARQYVKVALGGDGGDELFAGYPTLVAHRMAGLYERVPKRLRDGLVVPIVEGLPVSLNNLSLDFRVKRFTRYAGLPLAERHLNWMGAFNAEERSRLLTAEIGAILEEGRDTAIDMVLDHQARQRRLVDPINQVLYLDMKLYLEGDILVKLDRASMLASLEARVPLLNVDLIEHVAALPRHLKFSGLQSKRLFRYALRGVVPDNILARRKKGFGIPVAKWLRGPLKEPLLDALSQSRIEQEGLFEYPVVHDLLRQHFSGQRDNRKQLWTLFAFQQWYAAARRHPSPTAQRQPLLLRADAPH